MGQVPQPSIEGRTGVTLDSAEEGSRRHLDRFGETILCLSCDGCNCRAGSVPTISASRVTRVGETADHACEDTDSGHDSRCGFRQLDYPDEAKSCVSVLVDACLSVSGSRTSLRSSHSHNQRESDVDHSCRGKDRHQGPRTGSIDRSVFQILRRWLTTLQGDGQIFPGLTLSNNTFLKRFCTTIQSAKTILNGF